MDSLTSLDPTVEEQSERKLSQYGAKSDSRQSEADEESRSQTAGGDEDKVKPVEFFHDGVDVVGKSFYYDANSRVLV